MTPCCLLWCYINQITFYSIDRWEFPYHTRVDNGNTKLAVSHMQITCIYYSECTYTLLLSGIKNIVKRRKYPDTIWFLYINLSIYSSSIFVVFILLSTVNKAVKMHLQSKKKHQKKPPKNNNIVLGWVFYMITIFKMISRLRISEYLFISYTIYIEYLKLINSYQI